MALTSSTDAPSPLGENDRALYERVAGRISQTAGERRRDEGAQDDASMRHPNGQWTAEGRPPEDIKPRRSPPSKYVTVFVKIKH
jgi:hypothetical protein